MKKTVAMLLALSCLLLTGCGGVNLNFTGVSPFRNIREGDKIDAIDAAVTAFAEEKGIQDLSVGVLTGKETRFVNLGDMEEHTKVEIGAMTQMFTGMLIGNFEANRWLDRDQVVSDWFKSPAAVPVYAIAEENAEAAAPAEGEEAPTPAGKPIQVWQLATHTSGLGNFHTYGKDYATPGMLHNQLGNAELAFDPGTQQADSKLGYALLCETLRQSYNMNANYVNLVNNQVIVKMGLYNSAFAKGDALAGYDGYQSTTYDLTKVLAYCTGALYADDMLTKNIESALEEINNMSESLAFELDKSGEQVLYFKTGAGDGTVSCIAFDKASQTGVAINIRGSADLMPLAKTLLEAVK